METKKRILHIIQSLDTGGCEHMLLRTLPHLTSFDHTVMTLKAPGSLFTDFQKNKIPVKNVGLKNLFDFSGLYKLTREVARTQPDIIITYLLHADIIGRLILQPVSKKPIVPFLRTTYNHPRYRLARFFERATKFLVSRYLANSEAVKRFYVQSLGIQEEKITVIPNGIDPSLLASASSPSSLKDELGIEEDDTILICVANFHINKGHQYLINAFAPLTKKYTHVKLLLVGDGQEQKNLEKQVSNLGIKGVFFLGRRSDIPELLAASDIFVLPTLFEGLSNATMEAMASGLAVITTNIPENRELITHEQTGLLCEPENLDSLSYALEKLIKDKQIRKRFGQQAAQKIEANFNVKKTAKRWETYLQEFF